MSFVIGITGLAGSGKDTLAWYMHRSFIRMGEQARITGFATPIREMCFMAGFEPYVRDAKEVKVTMSLDIFFDRLQHAIDTVLRGYNIKQPERNKLYSLMIQHTKQFVSEPVGSEYVQYINISPREFMQILGTEAGQSIRKTFWVDMVASKWLQADGYTLVTDFRFDHEVRPLNIIITVDRKGLRRVNQHVSEDLPAKLTAHWHSTYDHKPNTYATNYGSLSDLEALASRLAMGIHIQRNL